MCLYWMATFVISDYFPLKTKKHHLEFFSQFAIMFFPLTRIYGIFDINLENRNYKNWIAVSQRYICRG